MASSDTGNNNEDILGAEPPRGANAAGLIKAYVERIERLEEDIKALNDDKRDLYAEAKGNGFDVTALKEIVKIRKQDPAKLAEKETILDVYKQALGMLK